jgi:outer membrane autotransporter protein
MPTVRIINAGEGGPMTDRFGQSGCHPISKNTAYRERECVIGKNALCISISETAFTGRQASDFCQSVSGVLKSTTAISSVSLPVVLLGTGLVVASKTVVLAEEPTRIPLEYLSYATDEDTPERLGIWASINDGPPQRYIFDTGSDQLNTQIAPWVTGVTAVPAKVPYVYAYGNETYGYKIQNINFDKLTFHDPKELENPSKEITLPILGGIRYEAGKVVDLIYTKDYSLNENDNFEKKHTSYPNSVTDGLKDVYGQALKQPYYADLDARKLMTEGKAIEENGLFWGTFGAGDFLSSSSGETGMLGSATKSGYIVAANGDTSENNAATPGCSPCVIVGLNANLRSQFTSYAPWLEGVHTEIDRKTFPGSGANASTEFEGAYHLNFGSDGQNPLQKAVPVLMDTGWAGGGGLSIKQKELDALVQAGHAVEDPNQTGSYNIPSLEVSAAEIENSSPEGRSVTLSNVEVTVIKDDDTTSFTAGLDFFLDSSVMHDLENKTTAYTEYFVSADNFTTNANENGKVHLSKITPQMGNQVPQFDEQGNPLKDNNGNEIERGYFGAAGVISGAGSLTIAGYANARLTGTNTYEGETLIEENGFLALAGPGSIENSVRVVNDGTLDIQEKGNYQEEWGVSDAFNDARIRSLSGKGGVLLLERNLILTDAKDTFAGNISDVGSDHKHYGGGLSVLGGMQTLSGRNDYSGMTTVGVGAALLLTGTGSITHDVTASGLLGNDGQIGGSAHANDGGVVAGAGSFGAVNIASGGTVAPGSALDPGKAVATLTVNGDFRQQAGSIYQAGLASSPDHINVGGSAAIDSGAQIELVRQGTASSVTRHTLLTAAGGVTGTYVGLTGTLYTDSPFVDFELTYDPTNVYLHTYRTATAFADVAHTSNQRSAATAKQALGPGHVIHDSILFLTEAEARTAFNLLSGEIHASVHSALIQDSHFVRDAANDRIRAAFEGIGAAPVPVMAYGPDGAQSAPATTEKYAVWGQGFGAWGHLDGDGNAARLDHSTGGFIAGGDAAVGETWRLGLLAGYSHTSFDVDDRASSGSSNNYHLGLYAGTQRGPLGFRSGLSYTWHRIETDRVVAFPGFSDGHAADYDAGTFQAFGELGYRLDTASVSFEPYANLAYVNFDADGFSEDGGAAALSSADQSSDATFTTLGLRASSQFMLGSMTATARGGIGWQHAFGDVTPETSLAIAGGSSFAVRGVPIAEDAALIEAGVDVNLTETAMLGVDYQAQLASDAQEHGFNAKLAVRF